MVRDWNSITIDRYYDDTKLDVRVGLGILDISRDIDSNSVRKKSFDMTFWMINQSLKMGSGSYRGYEEKVEDILENSLSQGDEICIVQCQGMMSYRLANIIWDSIVYFKENPDKFVMGHIMNRKDRYPGLHRQILIVNLKVWEKLGKPPYLEHGMFWDRKRIYQNYTVSDDKISAEYAPASIYPAEGTVVHSVVDDGSNWIDIALKNNISIDNLSIKIRECKVFVYPYEDTKQLEKVWNDLQNEKEVDKLTNYSAKAWIRKLAYQEFIEKDRVYAFNTERLSAEGIRTTAPVDHLFAAAAGFKPIALLRNNKFHENTVVNYYDWCPSSLNFKKHLLETWDGYNFHEWLIEHDSEYNFSSTYRGNYKEFWELELEKEFGSPEEFEELWNRYRRLDHRYHIIDIVHEPEKLFSLVNNCNGVKVLWTTNIWASMQLHWTFDPEYLEERYLNFEKLVPEDLILYGQDYMARDLNERIRNGKRLSHPRYQVNNKYMLMDHV